MKLGRISIKNAPPNLLERVHLMYEQEKSHKGTARALKLNPKTVRKWCHRWKNTQSFLQQLENQFQPFSERVYRATICEVLQDTPRSGAPDTFTLVGRILRELDLKPHRSRYWLNASERDTEAFAKEVETVCKLYEQAESLHEEGVHLVSTDEKTGIQALEREHSTHPAEATQGKGLELKFGFRP